MPKTAGEPRARRQASRAASGSTLEPEQTNGAATSGPSSPVDEDASVLYFAYGSNLNRKVLEGRRKVTPAASIPCVLHGHRLCFTLPGIPFREPGFASVEPVDEAGPHAAVGVPDVHGVLHWLTPSQWRIILETEGAAGSHDEIGYGIYPVTVEAVDGRRLEALTLRALPGSVSWLKGRAALPSRRYLDLIREGAAEHGLSEDYRHWLGSLSHYQADSLRQRAGAALFGLLVLGLLLPVFVPVRLWRMLRGKHTAGMGSVHSTLMAKYFHWVLELAWTLQDVLRPLCGCGATNAPAKAA